MPGRNTDKDMGMPASIWPLFDLEITTPRLSLRYVDDALGAALAELAATGIHDPATTPFGIPWTDVQPPALERETLKYYWRCRADTAPTAWNLHLAVLAGNTVVGTTSLFAKDFNTLGQFETGSWLGRRYQGTGIGKQMRLASLVLGFRGFGARLAHTSAWHDNAGSLGVTKALGYTEIGSRWAMRRDQRDRQIHYEMTRQEFEALDSDQITIGGLEPVREFLDIA